jgi:hypothetical protein
VKHHGPGGFHCHARPVLIMRNFIQLQHDPLGDAVDLSRPLTGR